MNQPNPTINIDIAAINKTERERYLREQAPRRTLADWFGVFTPWVIVLVFIAFYAQSGQHTSFVLDQLAPGIGWAAPVGVEAGLIYLAFRARQLGKLDQRGQALRFLLFLTAILTNFSGALYDVTNQARLSTLSAGDIVAQFSRMSAPTQAALIMVVVMALIVPIVCEVAGHGIADLVFAERRNAYKDEHWRKVEVKVTFQAVYNYYVQAGLNAERAQALAGQQVRGYFEKLNVSGLLLPGADSADSAPQAVAPVRANTLRTGKGSLADVYAYLDSHPEAVSLSINQLHARLDRDGVTVSRTTVGDALRERKKK